MVSTPLAARAAPGRLPANPFRLLFSARPWLAAVFMVLSFALGIFWFVTLVTLISTGAGLAITFFGLPLLVLTVVVWTWGARAERWRVGLFFGVPIPSPYRPLPAVAPDGRLSWSAALRWVRALLGDPAVWRDLCYLLLLFPLGIAEFVVTTVTLSLPLALLTLPLHLRAHGHHLGSLPGATALALLGLPLLLLMPYALTGMAAAHVALARALLGPTRHAELAARVDTLTETRSRAVDAALAERRRIERDLHDGAQQRLVALAMELGMAKLKLDADPAAARELVDQAHREAKLALADIRNLVRGIYPSVLADRGLDAAVSALAGRCPVPVAVMVELDGRLPETVESAAYFVVAEALTNVAKHSIATEAAVQVRREVGRLVVEVTDNGVGGADPAGGGLGGLADRIAALDGRLTVDSPHGGPTRVRAELPLGGSR